jgi:hypothetical protein
VFRRPPKGYATFLGPDLWKWIAKAIQLNIELIWIVFQIEVFLALSMGFSRPAVCLLFFTVVPVAIAMLGVYRWEDRPQ